MNRGLRFGVRSSRAPSAAPARRRAPAQTLAHPAPLGDLRRHRRRQRHLLPGDLRAVLAEESELHLVGFLEVLQHLIPVGDRLGFQLVGDDVADRLDALAHAPGQQRIQAEPELDLEHERRRPRPAPPGSGRTR